MKNAFMSFLGCLAIMAASFLMAPASAKAQNVSNYSEQGGASWVVGGELKTDANQSLLEETFTFNMPVLDSPGDQVFVPSPVSGTITGIRAVGVAGISTPTTISASLAGTYVTGGSIAIPSNTGVVGSATPTAANTVAQGQAIRFQSDGASTTSGSAVIAVTVRRD